MNPAPPPAPAPGADWVENRNWGASRGVTHRASQWAPPPRGGLVPLRPLRFFEVLDGGFRVMRHNPRLTIGLPMVVYVLWVLLMSAALAGLAFLFVDSRLLNSSDTTGAGVSFLSNLGATVVSFGSLPLVQLLSAVTTVSAEAERRGTRLSPAGAWRRLRPHAWRLLALLLLVAAMQIVTLGVLVAPGVALFFVSDVAGLLAMGIGGLLWVVPVLFIAVRFFQAAPALVTEDLGPVAALRRSWVLTRGSFWRVTGQDLCAYLLGSTIASIVMTPLLVVLMITMIIIAFAATSAETTALVTAVIFLGLTILLTTLITGLMYAYFSAVVSLIYLDCRMRAEGYDLQLLREAEERARPRRFGMPEDGP